MAAASQEQNHAAWKRMVPYLYDWFASHALSWPSLACRWGPVVETGGKRSRQRAYLSEQTDGSEPNRIVVVNVDVAHPRTATADHLQGFTEHSKSPHISKPLKTIVHPGEVNRMREVPQHPHVVVTHTDAPQLYVWNLDTQADRTGVKSTSTKHHSVADLVLTGHADNAEFALGVSSAAPLVASGGRDTKVLVWDLASHSTTLAASPDGAGSAGAGTSLQPLHTLSGHSATIEDTCWRPESATELASVGDDFSLLLWDTRRGGAPVLHVANAHGMQDVHCVAWSPHRQDLLVTGAADGTLKVWDRRKPDAAAFAFHHHSAAATVVEWSPHSAGAFASAGEDRLLCVWDLDARAVDVESAAAPAAKRQKSAIPPQMMFQHAGHRAPVVDFHWNPHDPWTLLSVADEAGEGGGGTLHLWRISDMVYRPDDEVVAELEQYRDYILTGQESSLSRKPSSAALVPAAAAAASGGLGAAQPSGVAPSGTAAESLKEETDTDAAGPGAVAPR